MRADFVGGRMKRWFGISLIIALMLFLNVQSAVADPGDPVSEEWTWATSATSDGLGRIAYWVTPSSDVQADSGVDWSVDNSFFDWQTGHFGCGGCVRAK